MQRFVLGDGLVSWCRIYSEAELRAVVAGRVRPGKAPLHGTCLVGRPPRA